MNSNETFFNHIPAFLKNKYFICLAAFALLFFFWIRMISSPKWTLQELRKLQQSQKILNHSNAAERKELEHLKEQPRHRRKQACP
jgi:hypothetical protein